MTIRKNLIATYAKKDLALTVARWEARDASVSLTPAEKQIAQVASSGAALRWLKSCATGRPEVTADDIEQARASIEITL